MSSGSYPQEDFPPLLLEKFSCKGPIHPPSLTGHVQDMLGMGLSPQSSHLAEEGDERIITTD